MAVRGHGRGFRRLFRHDGIVTRGVRVGRQFVATAGTVTRAARLTQRCQQKRTCRGGEGRIAGGRV